MEQFQEASLYFQPIKSISDQLSNVGALVSNERMMLQLVFGLSDAYVVDGSQICHCENLPPFYKDRSMVVLEETTLENANNTILITLCLLLLRKTYLLLLLILTPNITLTFEAGAVV